MTQLNQCGEFTHHATSQFQEFACEHGLLWECWTKHFWIRKRDRTEILQGNYVTDGLRGLMHGLTASELGRLTNPIAYASHPCGQRAIAFTSRMMEPLMW